MSPPYICSTRQQIAAELSSICTRLGVELKSLNMALQKGRSEMCKFHCDAQGATSSSSLSCDSTAAMHVISSNFRSRTWMCNWVFVQHTVQHLVLAHPNTLECRAVIALDTLYVLPSAATSVQSAMSATRSIASAASLHSAGAISALSCCCCQAAVRLKSSQYKRTTARLSVERQPN